MASREARKYLIDFLLDIPIHCFLVYKQIIEMYSQTLFLLAGFAFLGLSCCKTLENAGKMIIRIFLKINLKFFKSLQLGSKILVNSELS